MGNAAALAGAVGSFTGPAGAADAGADPPAPQDLSGTTGRPGAADAAADSSEAAVPSEGLRAPDGAADGLSWSIPRHADDLTTRPFGSGPTRQSDAQDTKSRSTCQLPTRPGPGTMLNYSGSIFRRRSPHRRLGPTTFEEIRC
jgi:hypothetical protein